MWRGKRRILVLGFLAPSFAAQDLAVTSGADYAPVVSPSSIAALFASDFETDSSEAALDELGRIPSELGGVTVTIANQPSGLLFVSRRQINLVVPGQAPAGDQEVAVALRSGEVLRGLAEIRDVSPALFSLDGSGRGPGAILNAVTGRRSPFSVVTPEIVSDDQRTRLSLFGTGFRRAGAVEALAIDEGGNALSIEVEFAGPAPGFFGLDQVNVVLDPALDGIGITEFQIVANGRESNAVTAEIERLNDAERPTTPQPPERIVTTTATTFSLCSVIPGQPDQPCLAYPFDHEWTPSESPYGIAAYELRSALGQRVTLPGDETTFVEWRVQLVDLDCSPEPSTQTFSWSVRAVDNRGIRSSESRFGVFEIGPCSD